MYIFGTFVNLYLIILPAAFIICSLIGLWRRKLYDVGIVKSTVLTFVLAVTGVIGAKLLYMLENIGQPFTFSGVSFFGCVFFVPLAFLLVAPLSGMKYTKCMDFAATYVPFVLSLIRIGCFTTGCCGGRLVTWFGHTFRPPVQLTEVVLDALMFIFLLIRERKITIVPGSQYALFLIFYGLMRFLLEFVRESAVYYGILSEAQYFSIAAIVLGILFIIISRKKMNRA